LHYDLVIIGTTVAALGLAETVKQDLKTLIINPTEMVAYEYMNTFKLPDVYSKGAEYYKKFKDLGTDILLNTELSKIQKENDTYCIEVFSGTGFFTIRTKTLVDTTEREADISEKSLNCLLINKHSSDSTPSKDELKTSKITEPINDNDGFKEFLADIKGVSFVNQPDENLELKIMKLQCPNDMNMLDARHKLIDMWRGRPRSLHSWKIATIGFYFETKPVFGLNEKAENYTLLPSAYYNTPEESFQAGANLGRRFLG
jgi:hypothetical protein